MTKYTMPRVTVQREVRNVQQLREFVGELEQAGASDSVTVTVSNAQLSAEWELTLGNLVSTP